MIGTGGRRAIWALFASTCLALLTCAAAHADETSYAVGPSPLLRATLVTGKLTIQSADVDQVTVSSQGAVNVRHVEPGEPGSRVPAQISIPEQSVEGPDGSVDMPKETFVLPQHLGEQPHDALIVNGDGDTTITVPRSMAMVFARVQQGRVTISNYSGAFFTHVRAGAISLQHVSGTGYAMVLRGPVVADDSNFSRIRARTAVGDMIFRGCTSNQIEANSTYGSIVYDNGSFQPGLAHFESQHGNVALGVQDGANGVQIGAHSGSGRVYSNFGDGTPVTGNPNDTQARVRGGGPIVTTSTQDGSVYLYNGSIATHPELRQTMQQSNGWAPNAANGRGYYHPYAPAQQQRPYEPPVQPRPYVPAAAQPRPYAPPAPPRQQQYEPAKQHPQERNGHGRPEPPHENPHKHPPL